MKTLRKNKYIHALFRGVVASLLGAIAFYIVAIGFISNGYEIQPFEEIDKFTLFIGILLGYFTGTMPTILSPLFEDDENGK